MVLHILTLAVAVVTLFYLRRYTIAARDQVTASQKTADAAAETARIAADQVEAINRPYLVISTGPLERESLTGTPKDVETAPVELPPRSILLINIGTGPAVDVDLRFIVPERGGEAKPLVEKRLAYARVGMNIETTLTPTDPPGDFSFVATYASMSGKRYRTIQTVLGEGGKKIIQSTTVERVA